MVDPVVVEQVEEEEKQSDTESEKVRKLFDMHEFYKVEKERLDKWEKIQEKILPEQYWLNNRVDLFNTSTYENCFEDQPYVEYNELCYLIKLGMVYKARNLSKEIEIDVDTHLRHNGDTILHVCAEYG